MKLKLSHFLFLSVFAIAIPSCGFPSHADDITSLTFTGSKSNFVVGQSYFDLSSVTIKANYANKRSITVNPEEASYTLKKDGIKYDINEAFASSGTYSLSAKYKGVSSKAFNINVFDTEQYVSTFSISEAPDTLGTGGFANITLDVNPVYFTVDITATSSDESMLSVTKVSEKTFKVKALAPGEVTVTFKAPTSASSEVSASTVISVVGYRKVDMKQTYEDYIKNTVNKKSSCPLEGEPKLLVIPVWFSDSDSYIKKEKKENVREDIRKAYFGSAADTGWHSVSSYYHQESMSKLTVTGTVSEWYSINRTTEDVNKDSERYVASLVKTASDWYFNNHSSDSRRNYDYDGDGYLDGVMLIYGAPDCQVLGTKEENLWAYCYWTGKAASTSSPTANVFFWASYDFMYGESTAKERTGYSYANGNTSHTLLDTHTFIHEMGHVFGLDDYYDYSGNYAPAGKFSMQDYNVGAHDPFSVMANGWASPYIPTDNCTITIEDFQSSHDLVLLTPSWNGYDSPFDEYLLLELYSPTGLNELDCVYKYQQRYPQGPNDVGIRLWHVDARLYKSGSGFPANPNVLAGSVITGLNNNSIYTTDRGCPAGASYQKYNLLQLIRNDKNESYKTDSGLSSSSLFKGGDTFTMSIFKKQFAYGSTASTWGEGKLDSGKALGWSFTVGGIATTDSGYSVTITFTKN